MNKRIDVFVFAVVLLGATVFVHSCRGADEKIPQEMLDALVRRREAIRMWALTCGPGPYEGQYSLYDHVCWQGDMTCYSGVACLAARLAGDTDTADARCGDVAKAQEPGGRWCRGPMFVGQNYAANDPSANDFSRDQTRGVFAYLLADGYVSKDPAKYATAVEAAEKWLYWIASNDERICLEDSRTCELTVGVHNMFYNVYRHLGVLPPRNAGPLARKFYDSRWYYRWGFLAETRLMPIDEIDCELLDKKGKWYPRHLKALSCLLYRVMNCDFPDRDSWLAGRSSGRPRIRSRRAASVFGKAARRIWARDRTNPFYRLLYEGVTVDLVQKVLDVYTNPEKPVLVNQLNDWAWQRHTSEQAWERSDGHDAIFLINMILAKAMGRIVW